MKISRDRSLSVIFMLMTMMFWWSSPAFTQTGPTGEPQTSLTHTPVEVEILGDKKSSLPSRVDSR